MNFAFSDEQEAFRDTLRRFLENESPSAAVRKHMETEEGFDRALWRRLASDIGLPALGVPEAYGGAGFGFLELVVAFEEMGRSLACAPFFSTVLAANAILNAGTEADKKEFLPAIASGERIATLALVDAGGGWEPGAVRMTCEKKGGDRLLAGAKEAVTDGAAADLLLVAARLPGTSGAEGLSLLAVEGGAPGVKRTAETPLDLTRRIARVEFSGAKARLVGAEGAAGPALERTLDQAAVLLAAECAGGAQRCLDMAVEYAKIRVQFGRVIGSFQAIKHRATDMLLEVQSAIAAAYYAGWAASEGAAELPLVARLAKSVASEAFVAAAAGNVQIHGGIGFTWEHDAHLYLKRAKSSETLLGDPTAHRARLAERLGL